MAEPTTSAAAATLAVAAVTVPPLMVLGISTGLRPDMLLAGFFGSLAAMALLNTVPSSGDTWRHMLRTTGRRVCNAGASAALAGYLGPSMLELAGIPDRYALALAFVAGAGAQSVLQLAVARLANFTQNASPPTTPGAAP
jgi:NaMN:DMB phosphoribosyltransferase